VNESGRPRNWKGQAFEASKLTSSSIHWDKFLVLIGIKTRDGVSPEDIGAVVRITQQMGSHESVEHGSTITSSHSRLFGLRYIIGMPQ